MKKEKELKLFNGRAHGQYLNSSFSIAAYTKKQAAELIGKATGSTANYTTEIREYYADCWGSNMAGIIPTEPCVYVTGIKYSEPLRLV